MPTIVVDAHEDIAYNALTFARDYSQSAHTIRRAEVHSDAPQHNGQAMLGLPDWLAGNVAVVFATLFVMPQRLNQQGWEIQTYTAPQEAYRRAGLQMDYYRRFAEDNPQVRLIGGKSDLEEGLATWKEGADPGGRTVGLVPLMEGADPILEPKQAEEWMERGVRIVGLSWAATRYAGGTGEPGPLTREGRELLNIMADLGLILDLTHASEKAYFEELEAFEGIAVASHSNPRALLKEPGRFPERHLADAQIARLVEHGGVIGVVPFNKFLVGDWTHAQGKQAVTLEHVVAAIDHICQIAGDAAHVGLGTDFDGGFGALETPAEIDTVADLQKIGTALKDHSYAPADIEAILGGNWLRILRESLP